MNETLYPKIRESLQELALREEIPPARKGQLDQLAGYVRSQVSAGQPARLVFICTHNSRRSHFGQLWAKVLADHYGVAPVETFSGGTEATALHPNAIRALREIGFQVTGDRSEANPRYAIRYSDALPPLQAWSKVYTDPANPQEGFCAIMTCSEADEACPAVFGAQVRISLPFSDPKQADGTPAEAATYRDRSLQIAAELDYVFRSLAG